MGQPGLKAAVVFQLRESAQHIFFQPRAGGGIGKSLPGIAGVVAVVDVVEIPGAGLVQVVEQAQVHGAGRIRPGQPRQHIPQHRGAVGMFGHIFLPCAQKLVPRAWCAPQHAHFVREISQPFHALRRGGQGRAHSRRRAGGMWGNVR